MKARGAPCRVQVPSRARHAVDGRPLFVSSMLPPMGEEVSHCRASIYSHFNDVTQRDDGVIVKEFPQSTTPETSAFVYHPSRFITKGMLMDHLDGFIVVADMFQIVSDYVEIFLFV